MDSTNPDYIRLRRMADCLPELPGIGAVEIARGGIRLSLSPGLRHIHAVRKLGEQLNRELERTHEGLVSHGGADLEAIELGVRRRPDLMVFREKALHEDVAAFRPSEVLLVVEVVSKSNSENDYEEKVRDYAAMGIPLYLLVDPRVGTGIAYSGPKYASQVPFTFGDQIKVGPWQLDTSVLLTYGP